MKKLLQQLLTEVDNHTYDLVKLLAVLSVVVGLVLMVYTVAWKGQVFNLQDFGTGIGVLFGGVGVALALKKETPVDDK